MSSDYMKQSRFSDTMKSLNLKRSEILVSLKTQQDQDSELRFKKA